MMHTGMRHGTRGNSHVDVPPAPPTAGLRITLDHISTCIYAIKPHENNQKREHDDINDSPPAGVASTTTTTSLDELPISSSRRSVWQRLRAVAVPFQCAERLSSTSAKPVYLLKDITGVVEAGKCHALMGPSGAGKTTLLDVIRWYN
eukprot:9496205-Pyramimonas_sp.AAC.1